MLNEIFGLSATILASAPPPLPDPPAVERWLFERPFVVGPALLGLGGAIFLALNRRNQATRGLAIGGGLALLGVVLVVVGVLVETPRERLVRQSRALVDAVVAGDAGAVDALLADDLVLSAGPLPIRGKALALRAVEGFQSQVRVTEHGVSAATAAVSGRGGSGASQFRVRAVTNFGPGVAWARLNWRKDPDGEWRIHLIELLRINGREPGDLGGLERLGP